MKWVTIAGAHFNTDNMVGFVWRDGILTIEHNHGKNTRIPDPEKEHYTHLCLVLGQPAVA